jgi:hypothetical protein
MTIHTPQMTTSTVSSQQGSLQQRMHDVPERSVAQRMKGGRKSIYDLLRNPPDYIETMKLFDLMLAQPKFGRVKVNKVLVNCRISPSKTIGGLSERQRHEILVRLAQ